MIGNLNCDLKDLLVKELENVVMRMRETPDPSRKLFFFSAAYGVTDRVVRIQYDSELLAITHVLSTVYNQFMARGSAIGQGERVVPIEPEMMVKLADLTEQLAEHIKKETSPYDTLQRFIELSFRTTGPGYYMHIIGKF